MPHHDKLKDLERQLDRLGLDEEVQSIGKLKMKMDPIELAMMFGGLNPEVFFEEDGESEEDSEEDSADDNDTFDYTHFSLGGDSKHDRKAAAEIAKEQYRRNVGGLRHKARFELDQLFETIDDCRAEGDPHGELEELFSRLKSAQMLFQKYEAEYRKLNKSKRIRPEQSDDAKDQMFYSTPTNYKYEIGQSVTVYETPHDTFSGVILSHRMDIKHNLRMYRIVKADGSKVWCPEFRLDPVD